MSETCPIAPDGGGHHFVPVGNELRCAHCGKTQATAETATFYITFGSQYSHEPHPRANFVHPDGWLEIVVPFEGSIGIAENLARMAAFPIVGPHWAFIYDAERFERSQHYYPLGCLARIHADNDRDNTVEIFRRFQSRMEETS